MTDSSSPLSVDPPPPRPKTPSKFPQAAASFVGGVPGTIVAIATALVGVFQAYAAVQESQATSRTTYDTLKAASEAHAQQIAALQQGQLELRGWVQDIAGKLDAQQKAQARQLARRSASTAPAAAAAPPAPVPLPAPPAIEAPTPPAPLPAFDQLQKAP